VDVGCQVFDEFNEKVFGKVFDCIEADSTKLKIIAQPISPFLNLVFDLSSTPWSHRKGMIPQDEHDRYQQTSSNHNSPFPYQH
jgi:hypothetical protein